MLAGVVLGVEKVYILFLSKVSLQRDFTVIQQTAIVPQIKGLCWRYRQVWPCALHQNHRSKVILMSARAKLSEC